MEITFVASSLSPIHVHQAVRMLEGVRMKNEEEEIVWKTAMKKLYLNLALCNLKQHKSGLALSNCRRVMEFDGKNVKAIFRMGQVCFGQ